jgi:predicted N-acetyltransferase YhbS
MPDKLTEIELRPASEDHIPAMAALWAEAFPEKPAERRARELREGLTYGDLSDCWIVEIGGRLAGALRTYRLSLHFWGRRVPTMGLAGVAVAPDFRRRGIGRRMCLSSLSMARGRGDVLCALFPFRTSFYRELGFVLAGAFHRYGFAPADLALYPGWDRVVRATDDGGASARAIYDEVAATSNGTLERTERMWTFLEQEEHRLYLYEDVRGRPTGYVVVEGRGGPPERSRLRASELVAVDREAYLGLLGWLSVQRDQWGSVVYDALPGEEFHRRLGHPRTAGSGSPRGLWFHSASILRGPMLRILDLAALVAPGADAWPTGGTPIQVRDPNLTENQGCWEDGGRVSEALAPETGAVLSIGEATSLFVEGRLPGQHPPPTDWRPNLGLTDLRLYDEF